MDFPRLDADMKLGDGRAQAALDEQARQEPTLEVFLTCGEPQPRRENAEDYLNRNIEQGQTTAARMKKSCRFGREGRERRKATETANDCELPSVSAKPRLTDTGQKANQKRTNNVHHKRGEWNPS